MARIKSEDLQLNIIINSEKGQKNIQNLKKQIAQTKDAIKVYEQQVKKGGSTQATFEKSLQNSRAELARLEDNLKRATTVIKLNDMTLGELRKNAKLTGLALRNATPGTAQFKQLNAQLVATKNRLKELQGGATSVKAAFASIRASILPVVAAIMLITRALKGVVDKIIDFEQANVNLSTILGKNVKDIKILTDSALELGRTTEYTASAVTGLQTELAKLGFNESQIVNMQKPVLQFATAVGAELPEAAALAGATLRMFGLKSYDTEAALASLAVATNKSALNFKYLQTALAIVGPVAKTFGFSLEDTTALLGSLANAGMDATASATATRNILLNLADSNGKLAKAFGKSVKTFPELMTALEELKAKGVDLNATLKITDKRSVAAFNSFLDGSESTRELRDSIAGVNEELEKLSEERLNTVQGSIAKMKSAWEGLTLAFSNSKGVIKSVIDALTDALEGAYKMIFKEEYEKNFNKNLKVNQYVSYYKEYGDAEAAKNFADEQLAAAQAAVDELQAEYDEAVEYSKKINSMGVHDYGPKIRLMPLLEKAKENLELMKLASQEAKDAIDALESEKGSSIDPTPSGNTGGSDEDDPKHWSLSKDKKYLSDKAKLIEQFNKGEIASEEALNEAVYKLEVDTLERRIAENKDSATEIAALQAELQEKIMKHKLAAAKKEKDAEKDKADKVNEFLTSDNKAKTELAKQAEAKRYNEALKAFEKNKAAYKDQAKVKENIERQHRINLLKIDIDAFDRQQAEIKSQHEFELQEIETKSDEKLVAVRKGSAAEIEIVREKNRAIAEKNRTYYENQLAALEAFIAKSKSEGKELSEEQLRELNLKISKLTQLIAQAKRAIQADEAGVLAGTGGELFGITQDQWMQFFSRLEQGKLQAEDLVNVLSGIGGMATEAMSIATKSIELFNNKEKDDFKQFQKNNEGKKKILNDRLNAGLMSQTQYDEEIANLKAEEDQRNEEMELKQAKRAKALALSQAIINTALSVAKAFAQWGWPAGIVAGSIMAALGATEIALIASQPISAYAEGGEVVRKQDGKKFNARLDPNKRGYINSATLLVGEEGPEYVIPNDGMQNPTLAPLLGTIEAARANGTLRTLNFESVYPTQAIGKASGGLTGGSASEQVELISSNYQRQIISRLDAISARMDKPVPAVVRLLGKGGIKEAEEKYETLQSRGRL